MQSVYSTDPADWATLDGTLIDTTNLDLRGHGSNGNEGVLYIPQSSWIEDSLLDSLISYQIS